MSRGKLTYRQDYFKRTKGIAGKDIYLCAYCGKICLGKKNVQLDHIYPKSKMVFTASKNATQNLVTSCPTCNRKKSNKVTANYMVRGYIAKVVQTVLYNKYVWAGAVVGAVVWGPRDLAFVPPVVAGFSFGFTSKVTWVVAVLSFVWSRWA